MSDETRVFNVIRKLKVRSEIGVNVHTPVCLQQLGVLEQNVSDDALGIKCGDVTLERQEM